MYHSRTDAGKSKNMPPINDVPEKIHIVDPHGELAKDLVAKFADKKLKEPPRFDDLSGPPEPKES